MNTLLPIHPVVLCGGSGTRLWPLSRKALPKQFAPLVGGKSLLHLTLERLALLNSAITCVTSEDHRFLVKETMDNACAKGRQILEPVARSTAAAMASAALMADADDLLLFAPSDHHIPDAPLFARTVRSGIEAALAGRSSPSAWCRAFRARPTATSRPEHRFPTGIARPWCASWKSRRPPWPRC